MTLGLAPGNPAAELIRRAIRVTGVVQGVGFRPFVHRLATELGLSGLVGNDSGAVFIEVQGPAAALDRFEQLLVTRCPPLARIARVEVEPAPVDAEPTPAEPTHPQPTHPQPFRIVPSRGGPGGRTLVPPDVATCPSCVAELFDPNDRRYRHPFITCTDCGPRFTIITDLPYDRPATTMAGFAMCAACEREYHDPADRRYHAQPVACPDCGPTLSYRSWQGHDAGAADGILFGDDALAAAQRALHAGLVVAVKGIGGYHLACRADDPGAVTRLRRRKQRGDKPFALLVRDLATARRVVRLDPDQARVLGDPARPIVLADRHQGPDRAPVADQVAPGNPLLGVMLAYSPVHHLLLHPVPGSTTEPPQLLVLTSANLTDEPLVHDDADAAERLPLLADAVLGHDRPIHVPCDDSVVRVIDGRELPIRRSRGYAPLPVPLGPAGATLPRTLAVGGELKNTFCLIERGQAFCSAHVGDMGSLETLRAFERATGQLTRMVIGAAASGGHGAPVLAADAHPGYLTRRWAERAAEQCGGHRAQQDAEPVLVQHHHAHVVSLLAEHEAIGEPVIGIAFDGTGYGADATVWGGEVLLLGERPDSFTRAGHLLPVGLPGGDVAVINPCRMALSYLRCAGLDWAGDLAPVAACDPAELAVVAAQLDRDAVPCSSAGRLFDAVAALLGIRQRVGYEAQAAIELEAMATAAGTAGPVADFALADGVIDHRPVIRSLVAGVRTGMDRATLALGFHLALARAVTRVATEVSAGSGVRTVGLTGGVFQNALLLRVCEQFLTEAGFRVLIHRVVPANDGGLSLGQAVVAAWRRAS